MTAITWLTFAPIQVLIVVLFVVEFLRPPRRAIAGVGLLLMGALLAALNLVWFATGGPEGSSFMPMRGGTLGAWLSLLTAAEIAAFGALVLLRALRGGGPAERSR